jgi:hypothetical protein
MAVYTRQSSSGIVDGGVIEAVDLNNEFDQLASAFLAPTFGVGTSGTDIVMTFDGETNDGVITWMEDEDYFQFSDDILLSTTEKLQFRDTALYIYSSADGQLDLVADTEIQIAATTIDINGAVALNGAITGATNITLSGELDAATLDISGNADIDGTLEADAITIGGTAIGSIYGVVAGSSSIVTTGALDSGSITSGFGTIDTGSSTITTTGLITGGSLDIDDVVINGTTIGHTDDTDLMTLASGALTVAGNVVVSGDLTITGDDLVMGTNTAGHILVADGTNFNPIAVTDLAEISTAASGDVLLAVDASGGGLKKITRATVIAGTGSSGDLANVVEDTSPQLGGNLDTNSQNILIDDAHFLGDENGNEQIIFQTTSSAVNQFDITNAATGSAPSLSATGDDSNIDLELAAKGTGHVTIKGNTNPGTIQFNCENNSHGVQLKSPAHSAGSSAVLTLPTATGNLIGSGDSGTLPVAAIDIDGATDIGAGIADADLFIIDDGAGGTNRKVAASRIKTYIGSATAADDISTGDAAVTLATSSGNITIDAQAGDADIIFKGTDSSSDITALTLDMSDAGTAVFNHDIKIADDGQIGSASAADAMIISSGGIVTFKDDILIKDGGTIGSASDADAITIASDGVVTMNQIPVFSAGINVSGGSIAGTLSTAAQANVTSLGTLTALTVDDVAVNGKVITMTGSTDDTAVFTVGTNGTLTIETTDTAAAAGNIQITADGTAELAGTTVTLDSGADIVLDAAGNNVTFKSGGTAILDFSNSSSDAVVTSSVQDKDIIFKGDDGGSAVTPLTMDMSAAGKLLLGAGAVGSTQTAGSQSGNVTLDYDTYQNFVLTATGNVTLANPSTESVGQSGIIVLIQDGTGSRTLSTGSDYEWPAGTTGTISTAANSIDLIPYFVDASNSILLGAPQLAFATPS